MTRNVLIMITKTLTEVHTSTIIHTIVNLSRYFYGTVPYTCTPLLTGIFTTSAVFTFSLPYTFRFGFPSDGVITLDSDRYPYVSDLNVKCYDVSILLVHI